VPTGPSGPAPGATETLVARVADGDEAAFDELVRLLVPRVHGLSLRLTQDEASATEVSRDVLTALWRECAHYDAARGSALTWVLAMTHRRAVERVRHDATHEPTDEPGAEARVEGPRLERLLAGMGHEQREALTLAYFDGLTHTQVAARLGIPLERAQTRIREALLLLGPPRAA
jgi:RNA polymerase sigma-70 factor, ECF subfamily